MYHKYTTSAAKNTTQQAKIYGLSLCVANCNGFHLTGTTIPATSEALQTEREKYKAFSVAARAALEAGDRKAYQAAKAQHALFSCATFEGKSRKKDCVTGTGLITIDFDRELDSYEIQVITEHPSCLQLVRSGKGWHAIFLIEPNNGQDWNLIRATHKATFLRLVDELGFSEGDYDAASREAERIYFLWHDPAGYTNEDAEPFPLARITAEMLELVQRHNYTDTTPGTANANNSPALLKKYLEACEIRMPERFIEGQRHNFILRQAANLNRRGTPETAAQDVLFELFRAKAGNDWPEFEATVTDVYKRYAHEFGKWARPAVKGPAPKFPINRLVYKDYIDDVRTDFFNTLDDAQGIPIVVSGTGAGKSHAICNYLKSKADHNTPEIHVILTPTAEHAKQLGERERICYVNSEVPTEVVIADFLAGERVFSGTYDALKKLKRAGMIIKTLIIDEIHAWADYGAFRQSANKVHDAILEVLDKGGKVIAMTATPQQATLIGIHRLIAPVSIIECRPETPKSKASLSFGNGNKHQLLALICAIKAAGKRIIITINRKVDEHYSKSVYDFAEILRAMGIDVRTAIADDMGGLKEFQSGEGQVLIGTKAIENGFDIDATGRDAVAIQVVTCEGLDSAAAAQLAGRFRDAKSVETIIWTFGQGGGYLDSDPDFDTAKEFEYILSKAVQHIGGERTLEQIIETSEERRSLVKEHGGKIIVDPLSVISATIEAGNKRGGLKHFTQEFARYVPNCTPAEVRDIKEIDPLKTSAFTTFCRNASRVLDDVALVEQIRFGLNLTKAANPNNRAAAGMLEAWGLIEDSDPKAALFKMLQSRCKDQACLQERNAVELQVKSKSERDKEERRKLRRKAKQEADNAASNRLAAESFENPKWAAQWLSGQMPTFQAIYKTLKELITANPRATLADAIASLNHAKEQAGRLSKAEINLSRRRQVMAFLIAGGAGYKIPAQVLGSLLTAAEIERSFAVLAFVPRLIELSKEGLSGQQIMTLLREYTGINCNTARDAMYTLRNVAYIRQITQIDSDGKRTTLFVVTQAVHVNDFNQSYDATEVLEERIERGRAKLIAAGVDTARIWRLSKESQMQPHPYVEPTDRAGVISLLAASEPPDCPF